MTFYGTYGLGRRNRCTECQPHGRGEERFKKHPIGGGPYKFAGRKPGVEVELDAFADTWRRVPSSKR